MSDPPQCQLFWVLHIQLVFDSFVERRTASTHPSELKFLLPKEVFCGVEATIELCHGLIIKFEWICTMCSRKLGRFFYMYLLAPFFHLRHKILFCFCGPSPNRFDLSLGLLVSLSLQVRLLFLLLHHSFRVMFGLPCSQLWNWLCRSKISNWYWLASLFKFCVHFEIWILYAMGCISSLVLLEGLGHRFIAFTTFGLIQHACRMWRSTTWSTFEVWVSRLHVTITSCTDNGFLCIVDWSGSDCLIQIELLEWFLYDLLLWYCLFFLIWV